MTEVPDRKSDLNKLVDNVIKAVDDTSDCENSIAEIKDKISELNDRLTLSKVHFEQGEYSAEKNLIKISDINIEIDHTDTIINSKRKEITRLQRMLRETRKTVHNANLFKAQLESELSDIKRRIKPEIQKLACEVDSWRNKENEISQKVIEASKILNETCDKYNELKNSDVIKEYTAVKSRKDALEKKIKQLREELKNADANVDGLKATIESNNSKYSSLSATIAKLEVQKSNIENNIKELTSQADMLTKYLNRKR